jgi:hypothetical protein
MTRAKRPTKKQIDKQQKPYVVRYRDGTVKAWFYFHGGGASFYQVRVGGTSLVSVPVRSIIAALRARGLV